MRRCAAAALVGWCLGPMVSAFELTLDSRALDDAVRIGLSRFEADRLTFHQPYRIGVGLTPIDWIDVITPFRRVALEAETRTAAGGRLFGQREAIQSLGGAPDQVDVIVDMTFHPQNTFVGVPPYVVVLEEVPDAPTARPRMRVQPVGVEAVPRFLPRLSTTRLPFPYDGARRALRGTEPLLGGVIVNRFNGRVLNPRGKYDVVVTDAGKELARARVDFGVLR